MTSVDRRPAIPLGKRESRTGNVDADGVLERALKAGPIRGRVDNVRYGEALVVTGVGMDLLTNAARTASHTFQRATSNMSRLLGFSS